MEVDDENGKRGEGGGEANNNNTASVSGRRRLRPVRSSQQQNNSNNNRNTSNSNASSRQRSGRRRTGERGGGRSGRDNTQSSTATAGEGDAGGQEAERREHNDNTNTNVVVAVNESSNNNGNSTPAGGESVPSSVRPAGNKRYWCHACQVSMHPTEMFTCDRCDSGFIEEIENDYGAERGGESGDEHGEDDLSFFSFQRPIPRGINILGGQRYNSDYGDEGSASPYSEDEYMYTDGEEDEDEDEDDNDDDDDGDSEGMMDYEDDHYNHHHHNPYRSLFRGDYMQMFLEALQSEMSRTAAGQHAMQLIHDMHMEANEDEEDPEGSIDGDDDDDNDGSRNELQQEVDSADTNPASNRRITRAAAAAARDATASRANDASGIGGDSSRNSAREGFTGGRRGGRRGRSAAQNQEGEQPGATGAITFPLVMQFLNMLGGGGGGDGPLNFRSGSDGPWNFLGGLHGNPGDYAWGPRGLDTIISQLMEQASTNGPAPATEDAIKNLAVGSISEEVLKKCPDCAVCKEEFTLGEAYKGMPCLHAFHSDCLLPWLRIHGTCPVCRLDLNTQVSVD